MYLFAKNHLRHNYPNINQMNIIPRERGRGVEMIRNRGFQLETFIRNTYPAN